MQIGYALLVLVPLSLAAQDVFNSNSGEGPCLAAHQREGELIRTISDGGWAVVLASSAKQKEIDHYLRLLDVDEVIEATTSSADVEVASR